MEGVAVGGGKRGVTNNTRGEECGEDGGWHT